MWQLATLKFIFEIFEIEIYFAVNEIELACVINITQPNVVVNEACCALDAENQSFLYPICILKAPVIS